jgi:hypothetical protein
VSIYDQIFQQAASAYGSDAGLLSRIAKLESGYDPNAVNNWDSNAKAGHPSQGLFQFIPSTFSAYARQARAANPAAWRGVQMNIRDPKAQALATAWAIANGHGSAWATYDRARKGVGGGPSPQASSVPAPAAGGGVETLGAVLRMLRRKEGESLLPSLLELAKARSGATGGATAPSPAVGNVPRRGGEDVWRYLQRIATTKFGLQNDPGNSQTTGGKHTAGSEHYEGRAIDFGSARNSWDKLNAWYRWAKQHGYDVLNEGDHIHVSAPGGGI